jgi:hypothetical protein
MASRRGITSHSSAMTAEDAEGPVIFEIRKINRNTSRAVLNQQVQDVKIAFDNSRGSRYCFFVFLLALIATLLLSPKSPVGFHTVNSEKGSSAVEAPIKAASDTKPLKLATPIFALGYPRSGSMHIYNYFDCNHVFSSHFCCCGSNKTGYPCEEDKYMGHCIQRNVDRAAANVLEGCGDYQVYAQIDSEDANSILLPQHFSLEEIHKAYPTSTFILNTRTSSKWVSLVTSGFGLGSRFIRKFQRTGDKVVALTQIYEEHSKMVKDFVAKYPSHTLVELNVDAGNAGQILSDSVGGDGSCWDADTEPYRL